MCNLVKMKLHIIQGDKDKVNMQTDMSKQSKCVDVSFCLTPLNVVIIGDDWKFRQAVSQLATHFDESVMVVEQFPPPNV